MRLPIVTDGLPQGHRIKNLLNYHPLKQVGLKVS